MDYFLQLLITIVGVLAAESLISLFCKWKKESERNKKIGKLRNRIEELRHEVFSINGTETIDNDARQQLCQLVFLELQEFNMYEYKNIPKKQRDKFDGYCMVSPLYACDAVTKKNATRFFRKIESFEWLGLEPPI